MINSPEFNGYLLDEILTCKERNFCTITLKEYFIKLVWRESAKKFKDEENKYIAEGFAYNACCKLALKFDPDKTSNAVSYVKTIIRSSFANTLVKLYHNEIQNT